MQLFDLDLKIRFWRQQKNFSKETKTSKQEKCTTFFLKCVQMLPQLPCTLMCLGLLSCSVLTYLILKFRVIAIDRCYLKMFFVCRFIIISKSAKKLNSAFFLNLLKQSVINVWYVSSHVYYFLINVTKVFFCFQ